MFVGEEMAYSGISCHKRYLVFFYITNLLYKVALPYFQPCYKQLEMVPRVYDQKHFLSFFHYLKNRDANLT